MEGMSNAASAVAEAVGVEKEALKAPESFSFVWLEALVAEHIHIKDKSVTTKMDRYALAGGFLFGVLGLIGALFLQNPLGLRILQVGFVLQCLCVVTALANACRQGWLGYRHQHENFARDLDRQLVQYNVIVEAVCSFPLTVINTHLHYVRDRKSRFVYRAGLLSGGIDKLGVLPLLLAMYLQFKDWSFGGWKALFDHVHLLGNFLLSLLLATYLVSWWAARAKGRLDLYDMVLTEASTREGDAE